MARWAHTLRVFVIGLLILTSGCGAGDSAPVERILFVGNSQMYVGNLPAVYAALANDNGKPTQADMIVRGGATLTQRVEDGAVADALASGRYAVLVLQERGGDLTRGFGWEASEQSREALHALARLGQAHGVRVLMLGTWQAHPIESAKLVDAEREITADAGIAYVEISETLQRARRQQPNLSWFVSERDLHPGPDLTLLAAAALHHALHGEQPATRDLKIEAPIYASTSGLDARLRSADAPPPIATTPRTLVYPAETVMQINTILATVAKKPSEGAQ